MEKVNVNGNDIGRIFMSPEVSIFANYHNSKPVGTISLADFLLKDTYKMEVEQIRLCSDKKERRRLKSMLPAITTAGIFSKRCNNALIQHSGLICMDIDGDSPGRSERDDFIAIKSSLSDLPGLFYAGLSVSGNGLFLIFRIKYPENHLGHFYALSRDLLNRGLVVDEACKDLARLRGASYDSAPFYNPNTAPYEGLTAPMWQAPEIACKPPENEDLTFYRVGKLVEAIERSGVNIVENYGDWLRVGCSIAAEFGEYGRYWYHAISCKSEKYKATECDRQYSYCLKSCSQSSISTLFWYCKQYGIMANGATHKNNEIYTP